MCNAAIHFGVSLLIKRHKMQQTNFFYLVLALVFAFVTIAVPVQLNGNWVTLLWTIMAALLFWIGRGKRILIYEQLSYVVMFLAFGSLLQNWLNNPYRYKYSNTAIEFTPVLNIGFLTAIISVLAFGFIYYTHVNKSREYMSLKTAIGLYMALPANTLFMLYFTFRFEIGNYFSTLFNNTSVSVIDPESGSEVKQYNHNLLNLEIVWIYIYSFSFLIMLTWSNILKFKSLALAKTNLVLNGLALLTFLLGGLHVLSVLRDNYLSQGQMFKHFEISKFNLVMRYIVIAFLVFLLWSTHKLLQAHFITFKVVNGFVLVVYASILAVLSSELINLMELANAHNSHKLGLSILWGAYSLLMIAVGIWKKNKYLRVAAMALFAITLVKLFLYDISHLSTIATTVVFVALGILLLIISFLYNKFKHLIVDENPNI